MIEVEIHIPEHIERMAIPTLVEQACLNEHLTLTLRTTLRAFPGCTHWHFKQEKERGTLEITWWERKDRLWFKVAAGRTGAWIETTIARLQAQIEQAP